MSIKKQTLKFLLICIFLISQVYTKTKEEWKTRVIYQLLTDRFARSNGDTQGCDVHNYCGGTFKGITNNLDYITGMGFNAIWISPIQENTPGSYHGYHMTNLYNLNPNFGTEQDFVDFVKACHDKDVWVMVDVVANHSGPVGTDYQRVYPFNDASHYHDYCVISNDDFAHNQNRVENCRLADLPDYKQENDFVRTTLLNWIKQLVNKYNIDGLRIDTIPEVPKWFWTQFAEAAGVYQVGEVFDGRLDYVANYQNNCLDALLNYPLYFTLKDVFGNGRSLNQIESSLQAINKSFHDPSVLGVFLDNHDNARFLHNYPNQKRFSNALGFSILTNGIPIVYYGSEQRFNGGDDPFNREPIFGGMNRNSDMYKFVQTLVNLRKNQFLWSKPQIQRYADDNFYAFTRDNVLALFTNSDNSINRSISYHSYSEGTRLCNAFNSGDCVYVRNGKIDVSLQGDMKVYVVSSNLK